MTDRIEPAIGALYWPKNGKELAAIRKICSDHYGHAEEPMVLDAPEIIALANAALPDDDPRKITREKIATLRTASSRVEDLEGDGSVWRALEALADALESYLPPE